MVSSIFRLDWILIDSIIIILLIFVLIGVKLFKERSRWRSSLSNENLEIINYKISDFKGMNHINVIKNLSTIQNNKYIKEINRSPIIIISNTNKNRKISYILAEGLASYGFNVVFANLQLLSNSNHKNPKNKQFFDIKNNSLFFNQVNSISDSTYLIINSSKKSFPYISIKPDNNKIESLLINPKFNSEEIEKLSEMSKQNDFKIQFYFIFSRKSNILMKNQNLKRFIAMRKKPNNLGLFTIYKAKSSFKYYETILLGIVIDIINRTSLKS